MSDCKNNLRKNIRKYRIACGYTQQNVADVLGLSRSAYTYYESGKSQPDLESITKIAWMLGITLDQLVFSEDQPDPGPVRRRVKHHPEPELKKIGDLTNEEKELIARLRCGEGGYSKHI